MPNIDEILRTFLRRVDHNKNAHRFGFEFGNPQLPEPLGPVGKIGTTSEPAHADHIHSYVNDKWHNIGAAGEPAFQNGWVNVGGTYVVARFCKLGGITFIEMSVKSGSLVTTIFTLPIGYRPLHDLRIPAYIFDGGAAYPGLLLVTPAGLVQAFPIGAGPAGAIDEFNIVTSFPADQ